MPTLTLDDLDLIAPDVPEVKEKEGKIVSVPFDAGMLDTFEADKANAEKYAARQAESGGAIKRLAELARLDEAKKSGQMVKSIMLAGRVRYTVQNKFTAVKGADLPAVIDAFGERGAKYIRIDTEYTYDRKAMGVHMHDPEVVAAFRLLRTRGIFPQTRTGIPTESLFRDMSFDEEVRTVAHDLGLRPQAMLVVKAVSR